MKEKRKLNDVFDEQFLMVMEVVVFISVYFLLCIVETIGIILLCHDFSFVLAIIVLCYFIDFVFFSISQSKKIPIIIFFCLFLMGCFINFIVCFFITIIPIMVIVSLKFILDSIELEFKDGYISKVESLAITMSFKEKNKILK